MKYPVILRAMLLASASITLLLLSPTVQPEDGPASGVQDTTTRPNGKGAKAAESRQRIAKVLDQSHRRGESKPILGVHARLQAETPGRSKDNLTFHLDTKFQRQVKYETRRGERTTDMIRFSVKENGEQLESGKDALGEWMRDSKGVKDLGGHQFVTERRKLAQETRIALQLLSWLDPGAVVRRMQGDWPVRESPLFVGKGKTVACDVVMGRLADYPFYSLALEEGKPPTALVQFFVEKDTGLLRGVRASTTVSKDGKSRSFTELVDLGDYKPIGGVMLPSTLRISRFAVADKRDPLLKITVLRVELNPGYTAADFRRPK